MVLDEVNDKEAKLYVGEEGIENFRKIFDKCNASVGIIRCD